MTYEEALEVLKRWKGCRDNRFDDFCKQKRTCLGCKYDFDDEEVKEAMQVAIEALEKQSWIPCSERTPEDGLEDEYLLTWREKWEFSDWEYHVDCVIYRCTEDRNNPYMLGRWEFNWDFWEGQKCEPVAWMPLPKPYKEADWSDKE